MVLHRQSPTLEHLLVECLEGLVGLLLGGKLDVCKALAQSPVVGDDSAVRDLSVLGELGLELRGGDFEEKVADIENLGGSSVSVGFERLISVDSVASLTADGRGGLLRTLGRLRGGLLYALGRLRGGFLDLVRGRAELADCLRGLCSNVGGGFLSLLGKVGRLLGDGLGRGLGLVFALS